jgi:DNA-binding response OmpR family regulator
MRSKILIVDDAVSTLDALSELLTEAGYDVVTAADFDHAKRLMKDANPDLVLLDVRLGAYNGLHLAIRERTAHPHRPVIVITGYADTTLEAEARHYGAEFLEKPISTAALLALIRKLLGQPAVTASGMM